MLKRLLLLLVMSFVFVPAADAAPKATPNGVYTGALKVAKVTCNGCNVRIVVSDDGLELTKASRFSVSKARGDCKDAGVTGIWHYAPIGDDGRFQGVGDGESSYYGVFGFRGRITAGKIVGSGELVCGGDEHRFSFSLKRTGKVKAPARGKTQACERVGELLATELKTVMLVNQRDAGCGWAHRAASALGAGPCETSCTAAGLACKPTDAPTLGDAAAQLECRRAAGRIELTRFHQCTTRDLSDYGAASGMGLWATDNVACKDAVPVGRGYRDCSQGDDINAKCNRFAPFTCRTAKGPLARPDLDTTQRCTDSADPRRVVILATDSSDVV